MPRCGCCGTIEKKAVKKTVKKTVKKKAVKKKK